MRWKVLNDWLLGFATGFVVGWLGVIIVLILTGKKGGAGKSGKR